MKSLQENEDFSALIADRESYVNANNRKYNNFQIFEFLAGLYDDPSHFVYEILQNAEDEGAHNVAFELYEDKLVINHNGKDFDFKDVAAITGIAISTKSRDDLNLIGKFGIGFKSVFAITNSPIIYSGKFHFEIQEYVLPRIIPPPPTAIFKTQIILPFNHIKNTPDKVFELISKKLQSLGYPILLFLRNINQIKWRISNGIEGLLTKESKQISEQVRRISFVQEKKTEEWLIFDKNVSSLQTVPTKQKSVKIEIAYQLGKDEYGIETIVPSDFTKLYVFFPTDKATNLNFYIQGPFRTTPARDNIPLENPLNQMLIKEIGTLVAESIQKVKDLGLLNVKFLQTLPIEKKLFAQGDKPFIFIYEKVREEFFKNIEILPTLEGKFTSSSQALIARSNDLRELLTPQQLKFLFNRSHWLIKSITKDQTQVLHDYLINELMIPEITPEKFGGAFSEEFVKLQDDEWIKNLYQFLVGQPSLWERSRFGSKTPILINKPFIRLNDQSHTRPFNDEGIPLAFLPSNSETDYFFKIIKKAIVDDERCKEFFDRLKLKKPDKAAALLQHVVPSYNEGSNEIISEAINLKHLDWIKKTVEDSSYTEKQKEEILNKLRKTSFLYAYNPVSSKKMYKTPLEIYISQIYTGEEDLEIYFEGNENIWFLDGRYANYFPLHFLKQLGCRSEIEVSAKKPEKNGFVILRDSQRNHLRGIKGFDPNCEIEGLETALKKISLKKAKIIWNLIKQNHHQIYGSIEHSTRKEYSDLNTTSQFSKMGNQLIKSAWVPDKDNIFLCPEEMEISNIHIDLDTESEEIRSVFQILRFKNAATQTILDQLPPQIKILYSKFQNINEEEMNQLLQIWESRKARISKQKNNSEKAEVTEPKVDDDTSFEEPEIQDNQVENQVRDLFLQKKFNAIINLLQERPNNTKVLRDFLKYSKISKFPQIDFNQELNPSEPLVTRTIRYTWGGQPYDLQVKNVNGLPLHLNVDNVYFANIVLKLEALLGRKIKSIIPDFAYIIDRIITDGLKKDRIILSLMDDLLKNGQTEPLILTNDNKVLDGNKRLSAAKLSKMMLEEGTIEAEFDITSMTAIILPSNLSKNEFCEIRNDIHCKTEIISHIYRDSTEVLIEIERFRKEGHTNEEIAEKFRLMPSQVQARYEVINIFHDFLKEYSIPEQIAVIQKYSLNDYFLRLQRELEYVKKLDISPKEQIEISDMFRKTAFIWFHNLIESELIMKELIPRVQDVRMLRQSLESPKIREIVNKFLEKEYTGIQYHIFFCTLLEKYSRNNAESRYTEEIQKNLETLFENLKAKKFAMLNKTSLKNFLQNCKRLLELLEDRLKEDV